MNGFRYTICKINIEIVGAGSNSRFITEWQLFENNSTDFPDLTIKVWSKYPKYYGMVVLTSRISSVVLKSENVILCANMHWNSIDICALDEKKNEIKNCLIAAVMTHLSIHHGLMLHSSLIDFNRNGLIFVGPSGIGKTTQAELWMKYRDAIIINGDMALIREEEDGFTAYGCPWHGSSPYCENRQVRLSGIIVLEQASENTIERLNGVTLIERMMNNIFLPHWYPEGVEAAMETVDHLLSQVPVYLMKCRPDERAVELAEGVLFTEND